MNPKNMRYRIESFQIGYNAVTHSQKWTLTAQILSRRYASSIPSTRKLTLDDHENQAFSLPDGRILGYAEYGNPDGFPMFAFHGFPSSRLEMSPIDKIARRRNIRLIALDRPGFGLSTFQPHRQIIDWPADVLEFAQHAGLKRFSVIGLSGGGPYSVACAYKLPRDMLHSVGVFAGGPPWEAGRQHMPWFARCTSTWATYLPFSFRVFSDGVVGMARWVMSTGPGIRQLDKLLESLQKQKSGEKKTELEKNDEQIPIAEQRENVLSLVFAGFAQGSAAMVQEAQLLSAQSWGFKFEDVNYDPIRIWHGSKDINSPVEMIRYMTKRLPHGVLKEFDDTHFTMAKHIGPALDELVPADTAKKHIKEA
jgi:pimeloyl-ACP methyl ester carboxylesterase